MIHIRNCVITWLTSVEAANHSTRNYLPIETGGHEEDSECLVNMCKTFKWHTTYILHTTLILTKEKLSCFILHIVQLGYPYYVDLQNHNDRYLLQNK